ncbi:hypothetical protein IVB18_25765 [Bradyrhizobium sp. 186]|uniref:hypothetical protein n=1 Tax=Bradyrhizobium sp. 186 TaxID=2782654 RepID=UPI002000C694|nr:hypothetical protein [Bradyrhizobium sp. 186]UPK31743.1 hypothetical protein IVB18_25765 [Bradyrhizobium sp. 186]
MANNHLVQPPPVLQQGKDNRKIDIWAAALLLVPIAAAIVLGGGTRISDGFEPFTKSANERVSECFEDVNGIASVSDELKNALASLSQNVQGAQKPQVQAEGND